MTTVISPVNIEARKNLDLRAGDTVRVHQKIQEKGKTRIQVFEGLVLSRKHGTEAGATFTVRRNTSGYGVEKIFPLYSPMIDKIEVVKRSKTRRGKLYYIREKALKQASKRLKMMFVNFSDEVESDSAKTSSDKEEDSSAEVEQSETKEKKVEEKKDEVVEESKEEESKSEDKEEK